MKILVVDDNRTNLKLIVGMVEKLRDCEAVAFDSPAAALAAMPVLEFDVAILDYQMPVYNGVEFLTEMLHFDKYASVPVVFITADPDLATRMDALNAGAIDFLTKPVDFQEFKARVQNIAALAEARREHASQISKLRALHAQMADAAFEDTDIDRSVIELREREREIIHRLTLAAGYKDARTAKHGLRVAAYAAAIAKALELGDDVCFDIHMATPLFDTGTALASHTARLKEGKLTESNYKDLKNRSQPDMPFSLLMLATEISSSYRERFDGKGYPNRLKGEAIPLAGRIVALAAGFEALTSDRPFKSAWPVDQAAAHISKKSGLQFDPTCVAAFKKALDEIRLIAEAEVVPMGFAHAS